MGKIKLSTIDTRGPKNWDKAEKKAETLKIIEEITAYQKILSATEKRSVLLVLQGMDAAGKDGTVRNIFKGINPTNCRVAAFKKPTELEFSHDFLWRVHQVVPKNGEIVVFNRSHYEDILVPTVGGYIDEKIIEKRYTHINDFEELLEDHGTKIIKCYLHVSKDEQLERLTERLDNPYKYWKHNDGDWETREQWDEYMKVYENIFDKCDKIPWNIIPADRNWVKVYSVAKLLRDALKEMDLDWPKLETERFKDKIV